METQFISGDYGDLGYISIRDARVLPGAVSSSNGSVRGGIAPIPGAPDFIYQLRQVNQKIVSLSRFRHGDPTGFGKANEIPEYFHGTYLYLGPMHKHFGHFVTESMTRIWFAIIENARDLEVVVLPEVDSVEERESFQFDDLLPWQKDIFKYYGVENLHFVRATSVFENLIVPQQGGILFSNFHSKSYLDVLSTHSRKSIHESGVRCKIFYRRPRALPYGKVAGEDYLADFLQIFDYKPVYPELVSGSAQIELARSASKVISTQGSALHAFNLLGRSDVEVFVIKRTTQGSLVDFVNTVRPYVKSVTIHEPAAKIPGVQSESALELIDVGIFLRQLIDFDPLIDPAIFDYEAYSRSVLTDVQAFTRHVP